jgi:hypothetical protein
MQGVSFATSAGELGRGAAVVGTETAELGGGRTPDELIPAHPAAISSPNTAKNGHQILEVMTKHNASTLGFSRCYEGNIGRTVVGAPIHVSPSEARIVTLKHGDTSVLVQSVLQQVDGTFIGEILGFGQSIGPGPNGMVVGNSIEFEASHVFGAVL